MPFSIRTQDGIVINNIPDDVDPNGDVLRQRVADERAKKGGAPPPSQEQSAQQRFQAALESPEVQQAAQQRRQEQAAELGPLQAGLVAAGRGLTSIGRGLGIAEPEDPATTRAFQELQAQQPIATTVGEVAGETAPFLLPGLGQAGLAARLGGGVLARGGTAAALGATEAGLIARGTGGTGEEQAIAGTLGGVIAGGLELALPVIGRLGGKIIRNLTGNAPSAPVIDAAGNPSPEFLEALQASGQTFDDVVGEATKELQEKSLDPRQAARKAFFEAQGLDPTRAQITRNASDFQAQQEAAKTSNIVRSALERQDAALTTRFNNAVEETAGNANLPTSSVADAITEKATILDQEISDLYNVARETAPGAKNVRFSELGETLRSLAPANRRTGGAIETMVGDLKQKGIMDDEFNIVGLVDVETAEDVRKLTNELFDPQNPFANGKLREIKDSIDNDVFKSAGRDVFAEGRKAKADFERELSRAKISKFDQRKSNLVRDVLENKINPDTMVNDVVFSKKWRPEDIQQLKDYISTDSVGQQAFNDLRAETMQQIKQRSLIGPEDAEGFRSISRDKLQKSIATIGEQKLKVIFTPQENKFLRDMLEVAKLREPVRGTALGRGPSAQAIGRLQTAVERAPFGIGDIFRDFREGIEARGIIQARPERALPPLPAIGPSTPRALGGVAAVGALGQQGQEQRLQQ